MRVVELEHMTVVAVAERGRGRGYAWPTDHARIGTSAHVDQHLEPSRQSGCGAAGNGRAEIVEELAPYARSSGLRHVLPTQRLRKCDEGIERLLCSLDFDLR